MEPDYELEDHASRFESNLAPGGNNYAIILRLSSNVKNPAAGYAFGRNAGRCDVVFVNDPLKRVSNIHFRIYVNEYGNVMIEDQSTNGTFVDRNLLTSKPKDGRQAVSRWVLSSGSVVKIYLHQEVKDLTFRVRIPRRDDEYDQAYTNKVAEYFERHGLPTGEHSTTQGNGGPVDIFKTPGKPVDQRVQVDDPSQVTRSPSKRKDAMRREWNGSGKYNRIGTIGKGAFAVVYKVTSKYDGRPYAAKELEKRRFIKNGVLDQKVENEMKIMERVQHPNIVRYIENFDWDDRLLIIIMEYVSDGDLGKIITDDGAFSESMAQTMSKQLLSALEYLHKNNITHRDVKPDNILINNLHPLDVKLTDFGLSKMVDSEQTFLRTFCGTLLYCAPEVYTEFAEYDDNGFRSRGQKVRRMPGQRYNHAVDIWSLGGVLFFALTTSPPYPVKTGISYSELLHKIMTTNLNTTPLQKYGISQGGIDFLSRMLQRRPEHRATITELDSHVWLGGNGSIIDASQSYDEITDDEDLQQYSQHNQQQQAWREEDHVSASDGEGSEKENNGAFGSHGQKQRLFGEVGNSAIGSSGVIPDDFLNLPVSMRETEVLDDFNDSGVSSTPAGTRTYRHGDRQMTVSIDQNHQSADQLQSLVKDVASQSLGDHEHHQRQQQFASVYHSADFAGSKRKPPSTNTSDEFDTNAHAGKPSMKRLKSEGNFEELSEDVISEAHLLARMRPIGKPSKRQTDEPVHKNSYWQQDVSTWHLNYPEMTQLQYDAFFQAAEDRKEKFEPGKTPLWDLAMRHFPPTTMSRAQTPQSLAQTQIGIGVRRDDRKLSDPGANEFPPTAPTAMVIDEPAIPDTMPPEGQIIVPVRNETTMVGMFESDTHSCIKNISLPVLDPFLSFGRHPDNTDVFESHKDAREKDPRVPKFAFKILLWKESFDANKDVSKFPYPWSKPSEGDEDQYSFWISTKATLGIRINGHTIPSDDPKNPSGPSRNWAQLHDGDSLIVWGTQDPRNQTALVFRCYWSLSSQPRTDFAAPPVFASHDLATALDTACVSAESRKRTKKNKQKFREDAEADLERRKENIERERERSRVFEERRAEAVEFVKATASLRRGSPASAPPTSTMFGARE